MKKHSFSFFEFISTKSQQAEAMLAGAQRQRKRGRLTLGGDKNHDSSEHVAALREPKVTPHVAKNTARPGGSAIDQRTTRHSGYAVSQTKGKRVEEILGWFKTVALMRKRRYRRLGTGGLDGPLGRSGLQSGAHEKSAGSDPMTQRETCAPDRNQGLGKTPEGQPSGLGTSGPDHLHNSRVWKEVRFVR